MSEQCECEGRTRCECGTSSLLTQFKTCFVVKASSLAIVQSEGFFKEEEGKKIDREESEKWSKKDTDELDSE
jgi:hypothetical protein